MSLQEGVWEAPHVGVVPRGFLEIFSTLCTHVSAITTWESCNARLANELSQGPDDLPPVYDDVLILSAKMLRALKTT